MYFSRSHFHLNIPVLLYSTLQSKFFTLPCTSPLQVQMNWTTISCIYHYYCFHSQQIHCDANVIFQRQLISNYLLCIGKIQNQSYCPISNPSNEFGFIMHGKNRQYNDIKIFFPALASSLQHSFYTAHNPC